ncbi:MAG TPA: ATP-binding protein [Prolixibacteraceae bacterium]|nr:ATP-binding protein [Prolixibacteraceae bacterium]
MLEKAPKILKIKSDKKELQKVEQFLGKVFAAYDLPSDNFSKVLLCVNEAVVNSIYHGNKNDNDKQVSIEVKCIDKKLDIKISDEGYGFNFSTVEDPTTSNNIKRETGRGIHIIKSLSDEIEFKNRGKCVRFKVKCL